MTFKLENALTTDVSSATVVTTYLLSASNLKLRPVLTRALKPGTRIVAHNYGFGDWVPEKTETFTDNAKTRRTIYLWTADGIVRPIADGYAGRLAAHRDTRARARAPGTSCSATSGSASPPWRWPLASPRSAWSACRRGGSPFRWRASWRWPSPTRGCSTA